MARLTELLTGVLPVLEVPLTRSALALAIVLLIGLAAWVSTVNFWYAYDDALITYRFARNLATGVGLVYNPGEWHLGTTAPLYALILGGLRLAGRARVDSVLRRADLQPLADARRPRARRVRRAAPRAARGHLRRACST